MGEHWGLRGALRAAPTCSAPPLLGPEGVKVTLHRAESCWGWAQAIMLAHLKNGWPSLWSQISEGGRKNKWGCPYPGEAPRPQADPQRVSQDTLLSIPSLPSTEEGLGA